MLALATAAAGLAGWPGGDLTVRPGSDFFSYANGGWIASNPIPADRSGFSIATIVSRQADERVRALIADAALDAPMLPRDERGKVGAYYAAFMDEATVEKAGAQPLDASLDRIDQATDRTALAKVMGRANAGFDGSIFALTVDPDSRAADHTVLYLGSAGLGGGDRDMFVAPGNGAVRTAYRAYIEHALALAGWRVDGIAGAVLAFETKLAIATPTAAQRRDDSQNYHPTMISQLDRDAPGFPWAAYFRSAGVVGDRRVIVTDSTAIPDFARLFAATPLPVLKGWAAFHLIDNAAPFLSRAFSDAHFDFHGRTVDGKQAPPPRWRDGIKLVSGGGWKDLESSRGSMGDAVGRLYLARWFDQRSRAQLAALVTNLQAVMRDRIARSDWMSPDTRMEAQRKVAGVRIEIGAPSRSDDYAALTIRRDDLFGNVQRATDLQWKGDLARLDRPVDRGRWAITPQTVNAYNYAPFNEVVFTAALLQPPAFDPDQDSALTYGGIGAIIGHELTHGFDDVGRRYDASGHQRDWWQANDAERFRSKADTLIGVFSRCEVAPGLNVDGKLTLGENIADIGGLQLAFAAYHASLAGKAAPVIDGLTGDQRFFLGFALLRRGHRRDNALRADVHGDPHTPDRCRVNEVVREIDGWYSAFDVAPSDALYLPPAKRVRLW